VEDVNDIHRVLQIFFLIINAFANFINSGTYILQARNLGVMGLKRFWSVVDLVIILLNWIVILNLVLTIDHEKMRIIEAILINCLWFKSLYFL
jgi:hypothetical protein